MQCLEGSCSCGIGTELRQAFEAAKPVGEIMPELVQLASRLLEILGNLVGSGFLPSPRAFGQALGAVFDLCVSLLYAQHIADTRWLYCPRQPFATFYPLKLVPASDLSPFYDMLFSFTQSWFRDPILEQTFSLEGWYRAFGGQNES